MGLDDQRVRVSVKGKGGESVAAAIYTKLDRAVSYSDQNVPLTLIMTL